MKLLILQLFLLFNHHDDKPKELSSVAYSSSKDCLSSKQVIELDAMILQPDVLDRLYMHIIIPLPPISKPIIPSPVTNVNP